MRTDYDVNVTWEGDNNVLMQQTAKFILEQFKAAMKGKKNTTFSCGWVKALPVDEEICTAKTEMDLLMPDNLLYIFEHRVNYLMQKSGYKLAANIGNDMSPFDAWNHSQPFYLKELALSFAELFHV